MKKTNLIFCIVCVLFMLTFVFLGCPSDDDDDDNNNNNNNGSGVGSIDINSDPQGASVYLDSDSTGRTTPTVINNVPVGVHSLRLTLSGYHDWTTQVTVQEDQTTTVFAEMTAENQPTPTPTVQPTPTPTEDPGQKPNLHPISIQVSGNKITSFKWTNNGAGTIHNQFDCIIYVNIQDPPYYAWPFWITPPVPPGTYTTPCDITLPGVTYEICLLMDTSEDVDETLEGNADNFMCIPYP